MIRRSLFALPAVLVVASVVLAGPTPREILKDAKTTLDELMETPAKFIPAKLMDEAEAVVIVPNTIKAGFVVGGRAGHGVAVVRDKDGGWGEVRFVDLGGASVGFQVGVQSTDVVLVFKNRKGLDRLLDGKTKLKLGADASVAAGPVGRTAEVATDGALKSEIFSYSRSRGLFAGVSLDGVVLAHDGEATRSFDGDNSVDTRLASDELKKKISSLSGVAQPAEEKVPAPAVVAPPAPAKSSDGPIRRLLKKIRD